MKKTQPFLLIVLAPVLLQAQGTFQNLDFESANLPPVGVGGYVSSTAAIPGWISYIGTNQMTEVLQNNYNTGSPGVEIFGPNSFAYLVIGGNYSVGLQHSSGGTPTSAAIGQTGQLPLNAASIVFNAAFYYAATYSDLQVTFDGNLIPLVQLGTTANYSIFGGDISAYAGQTGELRFTDTIGSGNFDLLILDNIQFSPSAVPEPSAIGLFALGGLLFGWRRWRI